jgi:alpha-tubulin suppressor-like RCC1 family protein
VSFGGEAPVQVACYYHGCCAVTDAAKLYCWGENNGGMHGTGDQTNHPTPTSPKTVPGKALYAGPGQDHMCAVFEGGKVQCWGQDWNKQLGGLGASSDPGVTLVASGAAAVVGGQFHTCVLMASGQVQCSSMGQSEGAGLDKGQLTPVAGISNAVALSAGKHYTCALLANASVQCWGSISHGATPAAISGLTARACD